MRKSKTILIVGGSGFVGSHLALKLKDEHKIFATYCKNPIRIPGVTFVPFDIGDRDWTKRVIYNIQPEVIIYAAGNPDPEYCEKNAREAERVHTSGAASVANISDIFQPKYILLSNDYVFDGQRGNYQEQDTVLPSITLGKVKVGAENFVKGKSLNYVIVRSSPLFGRGNGTHYSFMDQLRMKLDHKERIELPITELHNFAPINAFTDFIARLVDSGPRNKILHYGGLTKVSHFEFAKMFARTFGYDENLIIAKAIPNAEDRDLSNFIFDYSLNSTHIAQTLQIKPLLLEEGFNLLKKELIPDF